MTTMRNLAIIALLIGGIAPALAQNAPPTERALSPGAPGPPFRSTAHHDRNSHRYIVIPLTRDYGWWPQGQYRWFPFGLARWAYWCEPASYHRLSCGVGGRD
jgi:hypothetical protein